MLFIMFPTSTQSKYWIFSSDQELARLRNEVNKAYVAQHSTNTLKSKHFLTVTEERLLCRHYEYILKDFCRKFQPQMPLFVVGTAFQYFKRFYLNNSVMDYHPKQLVATCVYLACKVEEFNIPINQFVANMKGDKEKAADIILNYELMLMERLHFHLTVHNPYRPIEGFLIDIKTRCRDVLDPEQFRPYIDEFIDKIMLTDAVLLYSPSQIALATILYAADRVQESLDSYVTETLLDGCGGDKFTRITEAVTHMWALVKSSKEPPIRDQIKMIEKKLEKSRNQENNPGSKEYQDKMRAQMEGDDDGPIYTRSTEEFMDML